MVHFKTSSLFFPFFSMKPKYNSAREVCAFWLPKNHDRKILSSFVIGCCWTIIIPFLFFFWNSAEDVVRCNSKSIKSFTNKFENIIARPSWFKSKYSITHFTWNILSWSSFITFLVFWCSNANYKLVGNYKFNKIKKIRFSILFKLIPQTHPINPTCRPSV